MALSFAEKKERLRPTHHPWGDPCRRVGCGLPRMQHVVGHEFRGVAGGPCEKDGCALPADNHYVRPTSPRKYYSSLVADEANFVYRERRFYPVGLDGEGIGQEGEDHRYVLLAARDAAPRENEARVLRYVEIGDDGHTYDEAGDRLTPAPRFDRDGRPLGLKTTTCLDFILALPRKARAFGFSFGYDLSMMLRDIEPQKLFMLTHPELRARPAKHKSATPEPVRWVDPEHPRSKPYVLNLQGRRFSVAREQPNGVVRTAVVWDVFAFFGRSFVDALEAEDVGTPAHREHIRAMKAKRDSFSAKERDEFRTYCLEECRDLSELVEKLIASGDLVGLELRQFFGPGSFADPMMKAIGIRRALGRIKKVEPGNRHLLEEQLRAEYKKKGYDFVVPKTTRVVEKATLAPHRRPRDYWQLQIVKLGQKPYELPLLDVQRILSLPETGTTDGAFTTAVKQFQVQHFLPATGSLDMETHAALLHFRHHHESVRRRETVVSAKKEFNEALSTLRRDHFRDVTQRRIEEQIEDAQRAKVRGPNAMQPFVMAAFFGGRFEHSVMGVIDPHLGDKGPDGRRGIWAYDMSQAYPAAFLSLPCLLHASWEFTLDEARFRASEYALVRYGLGTPPEGLLWAPLPYRTERGSVVFPARSGGGWVWKREFDIAERVWNQRAPGYVQFRGAWVYSCECACPNPFTVGGHDEKGIAGYYLQRLKRGKNGAGMTLKGALNSCFGKACQSIGKDPIYQNYIWAGMVTAHCRARNLEFMGIHRDMNHVLSIATDGILSLEHFNDAQLPPATASETGEQHLPPDVRAAIEERNRKEQECADAEGRKPRLELLHRPLGGWERRRIGTEKEPKALFLMKPGVAFPLNPTEADLDDVRARGFGRLRLVGKKLGEAAGAGKTGGELLVEQWLACKRDDLKEEDGRAWVSVSLPPRPRFHGIRSSIREVPCAPGEAHATLQNRRVAYKYMPPNSEGARPLPENPKIWAAHNGTTFELSIVGDDDARPSHVVPIYIKYVASEKFLTWTMDEVRESFSPLPKRLCVIRKGKSGIMPLRSVDSGDPNDAELRWSSSSYEPKLQNRSEERLRALTQKQYYLDSEDSAREEADSFLNEQLGDA